MSAELSECAILPSLRCRVVRRFMDMNDMSMERAVQIERDVWMIEHQLQSQYLRHANRICFNLVYNPLLKSEPRVVHMSDEELASGTLMERVQVEEEQRMNAYENMLHERYESMKTEGEGLLRCRNCGSSDISWQQKQTRGADEAMTIFCTCAVCKNRWTMS